MSMFWKSPHSCDFVRCSAGTIRCGQQSHADHAVERVCRFLPKQTQCHLVLSVRCVVRVDPVYLPSLRVGKVIGTWKGSTVPNLMLNRLHAPNSFLMGVCPWDNDSQWAHVALGVCVEVACTVVASVKICAYGRTV